MTDGDIERVLASLPPAEPSAALDRRMARLFAAGARPAREAPRVSPSAIAVAAACLLVAIIVRERPPRTAAPRSEPALAPSPRGASVAAAPASSPTEPVAATPAWWIERRAAWTAVSADEIVLIGDQPYHRLHVAEAVTGAAILDRGRAEGVATRAGILYVPCRTE